MRESSVTQHDPLCCCHPEFEYGYDVSSSRGICECEVIAQAREDERQQAKRRVNGLANFPDHIRQLTPEDLVRVCANVASYDRIEPE
jgi:hypothetical protein